MHDSGLRQRIGDTLGEGYAAAAHGDLSGAIALHHDALALIRQLLAAEPGDDHRRGLASSLYAVAELHLNAGEHDAALAALAECEEAYRGLERSPADIDMLLADVELRRARVHAAAGRGASAIVAAQSAVAAYLRSGIDDRDPHYLDLARAFAWNADILLVYGDPDVAVASADSAIRMILARTEEINRGDDIPLHAQNLVVAARVAVIAHTAAGREDLAAQAAGIAEQTALLPPGEIDGWRRTGGRRTARLAEAMQRAVELTGDHPGLVEELTAPAVECRIRTSFERSPGWMAPGHAVVLARLAEAVLDTGRADDVPLGVRLGLEAHALFVGASQVGDVNMRFNIGGLGPPWAKVLLRCARAFEDHGDAAMALDLAAWAGAVALQLLPYAMTDAAVRGLCQDCLRRHGRLLQDAGRHEEAQDAFRAAARLGS